MSSIKTSLLYQLRGYIAVFCMLLLFLGGTVYVVRDFSLSASQQIGFGMARAYKIKEESNFNRYQFLLGLALRRLDDCRCVCSEKVTAVMSFMKSSEAFFGTKEFLAHGIIDGKSIELRNGTEYYADYTSLPWYQDVIAAKGEIIFSDAHIDPLTKKRVVTIAQQSVTTGTILAIDIYTDLFPLVFQDEPLPSNCSYFLFDGRGEVLYVRLAYTTSPERLGVVTNTIVTGIKDGSLLKDGARLYDALDTLRAVYVTKTQQGWYSVITIPVNGLLKNRILTHWGGALLIAIFLLGVLLLGIRDYRAASRLKHERDTTRVLSDSHCALYRINSTDETYESIKTDCHLLGTLPRLGAYADLLQAMLAVVKEEWRADVQTVFSLESLRMLAQKKECYSGEYQFFFAGKYVWMQLRLLTDALLDEGEFVLCVRNIETEKQEQLRQIELLQNSIALARESYAARNRFFANMSHDMRTPLNAIIGFADFANRHKQDPVRLDEDLQKIRQASELLLRLVDDTLELSRLEQGKVQICKEFFDLRFTFNTCIDPFRTSALHQEKRFETTIEISTDQVYGDPIRINQIINNIVSNAVKYTRPGDSIHVSLKQYGESEQAKYRFIVKDTGPGMSEKFLAKLYVPYERDTEYIGRIQGTGLGMPIVHNLVLQMGGQMTVESTQGVGTTVDIMIPLPALEQHEQQDAPQTQQQQETESSFLEGKRILIAEDNEFNMEITCEYLQLFGCEVVQAFNGKEALELFSQSDVGSFDCILMDMQMPVMDGCSASKAIRALARADAATVPIIALTANAFAEDVAASTTAGMNAHITKPIDLHMFVKTLASCLDLRPKK